MLRDPSFAVSTAAITLVAVTIATFDGVLPLHFDDQLGQAGIAALYAGAGIVIALATVLAARFAMRPVVVAGTLLTVGGLTLAGLTGEVWWWVIAVAVAAIGFGLDQTGSLGFLLDAVGPERMILAMVVWSQVFAIGYLVGPLLGGLVAETLGYAAIGLVPVGVRHRRVRRARADAARVCRQLTGVDAGRTSRSRRNGSGTAGFSVSISRASRCPSKIASAIILGDTQSPMR